MDKGSMRRRSVNIRFSLDITLVIPLDRVRVERDKIETKSIN